MRGLFLSLLLQCVPVSSLGVQCGSVCTDFAYESDDLAVCSGKNHAQIWNTTLGECQVELTASLNPVSYLSLIFTAGVTPAVRYPIGRNDCWDYVPERVAASLVAEIRGTGGGLVDVDAFCESHPGNSPSLGWEMRYVLKARGYASCASLIVVHDNYLASCTKLHADARALATFAYMISVALGMFVVCFMPCVCISGCL